MLKIFAGTITRIITTVIIIVAANEIIKAIDRKRSTK